MTEAFIQAYFTNVATAMVAIGHTTDSPAFFRVKSKTDLDAFDNAVRNTTKSNVLLLETGAGQTGAWDSPVDTVHIGLHLLVKTPDTDFQQVFNARDTAKAILLQIIARMRKDCEPIGLYSNSADGPLWNAIATFDSVCKYDDMDGVDGNWYGKAVYFDWKTPVDLSYNPSNWND